jgi:hypothetical protein
LEKVARMEFNEATAVLVVKVQRVKRVLVESRAVQFSCRVPWLHSNLGLNGALVHTQLALSTSLRTLPCQAALVHSPLAHPLSLSLSPFFAPRPPSLVRETTFLRSLQAPLRSSMQSAFRQHSTSLL